MKAAGLDIGSRTVKLVVANDGNIIHADTAINTFDPLAVCRDILDGIKYDILTATGYGRHLVGKHLECRTITEIKAFALGSRALLNSARTILDIGGQDIKTISLDERGRVNKFEMNDKCSAGTGKFLEIMAGALSANLNEFAHIASEAESSEKINSMCTVFAESEVISMLARGAKREAVALGIHQAVVAKARSMLQRVSLEDDIVFVGGVALNGCIVAELEKSLKRRVFVPENPQIIGAYGCALAAIGK